LAPTGQPAAGWTQGSAQVPIQWEIARISHMRRDGTQSQVVTLHYQGSVTDDMQSAGF
jgi:hypothetical protein